MPEEGILLNKDPDDFEWDYSYQEQNGLNVNAIGDDSVYSFELYDDEDNLVYNSPYEDVLPKGPYSDAYVQLRW